MTNGDRIRAMTDRELAEIIMCPYDGEKDCTQLRRVFGDEYSCQRCCERWLKQGETP